MTKQEIRNLQSGPEMDRTLGLALGYEEILVYEDLERRQKSEHERGTIIRYGIRYILRRKDQPAVEWSPSTTWEGMGLVVEEMQRRGFDLTLRMFGGGNYQAIFGLDWTNETCTGTAPYAVAMGALLALRGGASG
ncbi:hypothetical protein ABEX47_03260 [Paenibacillus ehimensis]|uniref:hypothetical protein n=1 Tax=Paenibacillus ehimensis TaxID=79264 RepID=UPI003D276FCD